MCWRAHNPLPVTNSWVYIGIGDVGQEIGEHDPGGGEEEHSMDHREVVHDDASHGEPFNARETEDCFNDDRASKEVPDLPYGWS